MPGRSRKGIAVLVTVLLTIVAASIAYSVAHQTVLQARSVTARSDAALAVDVAQNALSDIESQLGADPTAFLKAVLPTERARICVDGSDETVVEPNSSWPANCGTTWTYQKAAAPGPVRVELSPPSPDNPTLGVRVLARVGDTDAGVDATYITSAGRWVWASTAPASLASAQPSQTVAIQGNVYSGGDMTTPAGGGVTVTDAMVGADGVFSSAPDPYWGSPSDVPVPADYDGDGDLDRATFRAADGRWALADMDQQNFGTTGDVAVPADYDGDGVTDIAIWRPATGTWHRPGQTAVQWGQAGDIPVPADFDGDGVDELAVFRPNSARWYVHPDTVGVAFGATNDIPLPADFDGDGDDDMAVWRPGNGTWYVLNQPTRVLGMTGDRPVPADYDGNGVTDIAVWRPSNASWYIGAAPPMSLGASGDIPVPGDYNADGRAEPVVWRPSVGGWYSTNTAGTLESPDGHDLKWYSQGSGANGIGDIRDVQPSPLTEGSMAVHAARIDTISCPTAPMANVTSGPSAAFSTSLCIRPGAVLTDFSGAQVTVPASAATYMVVPGVGDDDHVKVYVSSAATNRAALVCAQPCSLPAHAGAMMSANTHPGELAYWTPLGEFRLPASGVVAAFGDVYIGTCSGPGHEYAVGNACMAQTGDNPGVRARKSLTVVAGTRQTPRDVYLGAPISVEGHAQVGVIATNQVIVPYWARPFNKAAGFQAHLLGLGLGTQGSATASIAAFPENLTYAGPSDTNWASQLVVTGSMTGTKLPLGMSGARAVTLRFDPRTRIAAPPWFPGTDQGWFRLKADVLSGGEACGSKVCAEF